ncbi:MAG: 5'-nucleotidase C-terminal domain-containing protein [Actinobacteria bacterium]|nr:5'-nucleotidase C-terminal domain-containing protein [Actinomycetota bacterium]MBU4390958.1 5'-nucleotidase C-terminal domain-containing protein [Actinomycetota bacterium]MBU4401933.1 5'-nucleotidase C-terminal domain-containing protein [Actinomycetota bacterium]MBU4441877.1 5'-nucleotidase C-terminal domain-containing protein [Actinomycetota bacterium]
MSDFQGVKGMLSMLSKRSLIVIVALAVVCAMVAVPLFGSAARKAQGANGVKDFTILQTNDEHSNVYPYDLAFDYPGNPTTGAFSRVAKTMGDIKAAKLAAGEPVLTLSSGDWSQGTLFSWLETGAAPELFLFQQMGYDAVTLGNHDIELGPQYLEAELAAAKAAGVNLPVLSSNITFSNYPPAPGDADEGLYAFYRNTETAGLYIQRYATKVLSPGLKVGMFGLLGVDAEAVAPGAAPLTFGNVPGDPEDPMSFVNRVITAQNMVDTLRTTESCDVVVCLSHMGTYEEKQLADYVPGIDVIMGGHSHDLIYPAIIQGPGSTIIVQAKANAEYLGELELQYDPGVASGPKVTVRNSRAIHMDQSVGTDAGIDGIVNGFVAAINGALGFDCLGPYAETDLFGDGGFSLTNGPSMSETNIGDLITDTYLAMVNQLQPPPTAPTRLAFGPDGFIRAGVVKGAAGIFSFYDLYRTLPLGGSPYDLTTPGYPLVSFYLFGAEIQGVMNMVLDMNRSDFFLQVSGMKYSYDPNAAEGDKIKSLTVDNGAGAYEPIQPATLYKLATDYGAGSFLVSFGLYPRDNAGAQVLPTPTEPDPMKGFIVYQDPPANTVELKAWQALTTVVANFPDLDGDFLPNIPPTYSTTQGRITRLNSVPTITTLSPAGKTAGDAGFTLTVNGTNFVAGSKVRWNGADLTTTYVSATRLTATVPAADIANVGTADVTVFNPAPGGGISNVKTFTVNAPRPADNSTWYLAEGSTAWGFDCYISIENPNNEAVTASIGYMTDSGQVDAGEVNLPANSQTTVNPRDTLWDTDFSTKVECKEGKTIAVDRTMTWAPPGAGAGVAGDGHCSIGVTSPATNWYLAEGSSAWGFECWLLIQNPNATEATCQVAYMIEGANPKVFEKKIPANSRKTYNMASDIGAADASIMVESDIPVIPERAMYRNNRQMGHDSIGTAAPALSYYLAEGTTDHGFTAYVLVQNPNPTDTDVTITYMTSSGAVPQAPFTMPSTSRKTIRVNDVMPGTDFSTQVTGSQPIIAERAMYWGEGTEAGEASHGSIGLAAPHTTFYLPDGRAGDGYETYTLVMNPNATEVTVEISYLTPDGKGNVTFEEMITANSRKTFSMADKGISGRAAVMVTCKTSDKKIMVERAMYWNSRGAGTDTIGGYDN